MLMTDKERNLLSTASSDAERNKVQKSKQSPDNIVLARRRSTAKLRSTKRGKKISRERSKKYYGRVKNPANRGKPWLRDDIVLLFAREMTDFQIAVNLGRSISSVSAARRKFRKTFGPLVWISKGDRKRSLSSPFSETRQKNLVVEVPGFEPGDLDRLSGAIAVTRIPGVTAI